MRWTFSPFRSDDTEDDNPNDPIWCDDKIELEEKKIKMRKMRPNESSTFR